MLAVPLAQYSGLDIHMVSTPKCKSYPEIPLEIPDCGATIPAVLPDIYKTDQLTYEERWKAYSVDILGKIPFNLLLLKRYSRNSS